MTNQEIFLKERITKFGHKIYIKKLIIPDDISIIKTTISESSQKI